MRGLLLAAFFAVLVWTGLAGAATNDYGARSGDNSAHLQYRHEGDAPEEFNVACSSTAWTAVVAADRESRSVNMIAVSSNTAAVCLSSATSSGTCNASKEGVHLDPGSSLTDYTTRDWACRSTSGNLDRVTGYRSKHSHD